jgi:MoaA/NifB/PqqE/SkfB family radical SAM enzyme
MYNLAAPPASRSARPGSQSRNLVRSDMTYDVIGDWQINLFCNFRCVYCFFPVPKRRNRQFVGHHPDQIVKGFNKSGLVWLIHMSGGEPFLQPDFVQLCRRLTENHYISINTNLSTRTVHDFAEQVDPSRVAFVHCSLHIDERERLGLTKDFIDKYRFLRERGFTAYVSQVMYPPLLGEFVNVYGALKQSRVAVNPKSFRGYYRGRLYPAGYSDEDRRRILNFELAEKPEKWSSVHLDPNMDRYMLWGDLSFKGLLCAAGKDFVAIEYDGSVMRCHGQRTKIGNIFEGRVSLLNDMAVCMAEICPCPYYGLRYAEPGYKILKARSFGYVRRLAKEMVKAGLRPLLDRLEILT